MSKIEFCLGFVVYGDTHRLVEITVEHDVEKKFRDNTRPSGICIRRKRFVFIVCQYRYKSRRRKKLKKLLFFALTLVMALPLAACGGNNNDTTINNTHLEQEKIITFTLDNSKTSEDFIESLFLTRSMRSWGNKEYDGQTQKALSSDGELQNVLETGDIAYRSSGNSFEHIFEKAENPTLSSPLIKIGKITSDVMVSCRVEG